jgi:hypothetical protein
LSFSSFGDCRIGKRSAAGVDLRATPGQVLPITGKALQTSTTIFHVYWERTMSIFGTIMNAIFGSKASAAPAGGAAPGPTVDVAPILDKAVAAKGEKLDWKHSIVDLMKALDIDSSLSARKELAKELGYTGDTNDSASMNIWLHKQVMTKLAANGGKLPPEIKH